MLPLYNSHNTEVQCEECDGWVHITCTELEYSNLSDSTIYSGPDSTVFIVYTLLCKVTNICHPGYSIMVVLI